MCVNDTFAIDDTILQILLLKIQLSQNEKQQSQSNPLSRKLSKTESTTIGFRIVDVFV